MEKIDEVIQAIREDLSDGGEEIKRINGVDLEGSAIFGSSYVTSIALYACAVEDVSLLRYEQWDDMRWANVRYMWLAHNN